MVLLPNDTRFALGDGRARLLARLEREGRDRLGEGRGRGRVAMEARRRAGEDFGSGGLAKDDTEARLWGLDALRFGRCVVFV